jgi:hypothetical protein
MNEKVRWHREMKDGLLRDSRMFDPGQIPESKSWMACDFCDCTTQAVCLERRTEHH